ncbi:MAG TPA: DUF3156 family protein [Acidimicrobiia bacterium]|nr:DUF3156 family protein [Acidimicrobiia bacterium]
MARSVRPGPPSSRLVGLIEGDFSGYERDSGEDRRVRFVPTGDGPVFDVVSRVERRFLGRTEIAVFRADLPVSFPDEGRIEMRHTGRLKRQGVTAVPLTGGESVERVVAALATDPGVARALQPLDFTHFEISLGPSGCRAEVELMGASHVAIALPPIRSYVHLHGDQREAMISGIGEVARVIGATV